jgi:hypothetical protein
MIDAKTYLGKYADLVGKIKRYEERLAMVNATLENKSTELDGLPRGTKTSNPTEKAAIQLIETKEKLQSYLLVAETMRQQILDEIELIPEPIYRELIYSRYILLMTWEGVTDRVSDVRRTRRKGKGHSDERYSVSHVMGPMHGRALQSFETILKNNIE